MSDAMTVGIVGGGASGVMVAAQLLRAGRVPRVVLIERADAVGQGVAYAPGPPSLLLNVPASGMSALPSVPDHFVRWLGAATGRSDSSTFAPRALYGRYLADVLDAAASASPSTLERVRADVTAVFRRATGVVVGLRDGRHVEVDACVLALGLFPPSPPAGVPRGLLADPRYVADPWEPGALERVDGDEDVLLLGTGLTAVDVALMLAERGGTGTVHAASRHGWLPRAHLCTAVEPWPVTFPAAGANGRTAADVVRAVRTELRAAQRAGRDWRSVVDGMRPLTQHVWRSLPDHERVRLLRRVGRLWEVHRHRMAPPVAATVDHLQAAGRLCVHAGRVGTARPVGGRISVQLVGGGGETALLVDRVINCTGPSCDVTRAADPLVRQLLSTGAARPGPLGLGLGVDADGALVDTRGNASPDLFTIGSLRKGALWETTAVPEIAAQAAALADVLVPAAPRTAQREAV
ncbi:MAG: FAD/NAD(P)-binding protein [Actinobacteria bacterium]|nr:FAD/NAD(P)-binding protein [Actinomycetota bacterium]